MASRKSKTPHVVCHMCTSIDGKILSSRWGKIPGGKDSASLFESTADSFKIGAWLVGTTTMDEFDGKKTKLPRPKAGTPRIPRTDHVADPKAKTFGIGADAKGVLRFKTGEVSGDHVVLLVSERVGQDYLAHLRAAGVSYLFCGAREIDPRTALEKLRAVLGIKKLMLQGGGKFNGAMLAAGLIDEISQVIVPVVDGGVGVSSFFDIPGEGPADGKGRAAARLKFKRAKSLPGGVHWVRYRVV